MDLFLPTEIAKPKIVDPRLIVILSPPKTGKTSSCMQLPKSLLLDLEDNNEFFEGTAINIKQKALEYNLGLGTMLIKYAETIKKKNLELGKPLYDFIIIDTLTVLEEISRKKAFADFKNSNIGKSKTYEHVKDVIKDLAKGAGYDYLYSAYNEMFSLFQGLAGKSIIYTAHKKIDKNKKGDEEIEITDINLTGQLKTMTTSRVDAIGHLYRSSKQPGVNVMSFQKNTEDTVFGSRCKHLRDKKFKFSVFNKDTDELTTYWNLIFQSLNETGQKMEEIQEDYISEIENDVKKIEVSEYPE